MFGYRYADFTVALIFLDAVIVILYGPSKFLSDLSPRGRLHANPRQGEYKNETIIECPHRVTPAALPCREREKQATATNRPKNRGRRSQ